MGDHETNRLMDNDPLAIWRSLTLRISQQPQNIKLHTQRLLFALENGLADYASGALQDLFICLKQKGMPLRQRLFSLLSPVMMQSERAYFQRWLADNTDRNLPCYRYPGSVFSSDTCQDDETLADNPSLNARPTFNDQLAEARYNLEIGQIVKAQALLENICIKDDSNVEVVKELQNVYSSTQSKDALLRFTQRLTENGKPLSATWKKLLDAAEDW